MIEERTSFRLGRASHKGLRASGRNKEGRGSIISKIYLTSRLQHCETYFMALVFVPNITLLYIEFLWQFNMVRPR